MRYAFSDRVEEEISTFNQQINNFRGLIPSSHRLYKISALKASKWQAFIYFLLAVIQLNHLKFIDAVMFESFQNQFKYPHETTFKSV